MTQSEGMHCAAGNGLSSCWVFAGRDPHALLANTTMPDALRYGGKLAGRSRPAPLSTRRRAVGTLYDPRMDPAAR
jgi:hypothetical protein